MVAIVDTLMRELAKSIKSCLSLDDHTPASL